MGDALGRYAARFRIRRRYIDGGLLYLVTDNVQLDASVGYGLNELALDYFCGFGVTIRR